LRDRTRGYQTKEEWYSNGYLLQLFGPKVILEKLQAYMPEPEVKAEITSADGVVGKSFESLADDIEADQ
jgi:hypothetical protein